MQLDGILNNYESCREYSLNSNVSNYLTYIDSEPFFVSPSLNSVKTSLKGSTLNPKFVLFSAPGATGKSTLAKYIGYKYRAIYWDLAKVKLGTNSFAGSILNAVGAPNYSDFISDLNSGNVMLVIDAFDEAEIISGRKMLGNFISDINSNLISITHPTIFLLARTDTAQYIATYCAENSIAISHYEIGFFQETAAKQFIQRSILSNNTTPTLADLECINAYYDVIHRNISGPEGSSFLGYAPVLQAISVHIKSSPNRARLLSELAEQTDCVEIIMSIMKDLMRREQYEKIVPAFKQRCSSAHPEFSSWDSVYSEQEQFTRLIYYILFQDTKFSNYPINLPPQLIDDYQAVIDTLLPQHPFIRIFTQSDESTHLDFTGPAFRDYSLACILKDPAIAECAQLYFEEAHSQSYFPSQIFFDCYTTLCNQTISSTYLSYLYEAFKAKTTALERPYLQCSEIASSNGNSNDYIAVFGVLNKNGSSTQEDIIEELLIENGELSFDQLTNVSIDAPSINVNVGRRGSEARISNSSIIAKTLNFQTRDITIESFAPEGCLLIARESITGENPAIEIVGSENLRVSAPNVNEYYRLIPYKYDFEDPTSFDITKFIHSLRCIMIEFRTHRKDTLAKTADRIEHVTVGNSKSKRAVLNYLKDTEIIYESAHLYKVNESKMQEKGIFFAAMARMDTILLKPAFDDFTSWLANNSDR